MASQMQPPVLAGLTGMARRLVSEGVLPEAEVRKAVQDAAEKEAALSAWLVDNNLVDSGRLAQVASAEFGMPLMDIGTLVVTNLPMDLVTEALITKHQALPLFKRGKRLFVGIADPMQSHALDEIKFHSNHMVEPVLVERSSLQRVIETALNTMSTNVQPALATVALDELTLEGGDDEEGDHRHRRQLRTTTPRSSSSSTRSWSTPSSAALRISISSRSKPIYRVRLRMDGMLRAVATPPVKLGTRIASRLKVMSGLDIAERRVPQDGRIKLNLTKTRAIDFRVSTLPTLFGEKIVLRILDGSSAKLGIDKLGYEEVQKNLYLDAIDKPYGMVLVTGPTGSGKTVSLYTALNILNTDGRNISTVEDPVEIRVEGINQVQQNVKRGMTFAAALRSFLRQDPDVIMVGEIRDLETAEIAIKAAQTGHMVLSTLHTNDAPQTIARLMNMGIAPYNITSSVTLIIAQRLARRLHDCKRPLELPPAALLAEGFTQAEIDAGFTVYEAVGCDSCNEGYKGRLGIYQVMPMAEEIQQIILQGGNALQIAEAAKKAGINDLRASALLKVRNGMTSLAEINRVTKD